MAVIGIFGGSFNPPHEGHIGIAVTSKKAIGLDEVWMLVTPGSPLKDPESYAPLDHRLEMCRIMTREFGVDQWLHPSDMERHLNTNQTADVLKHIKDTYPQHQFVWIMGADNLADFHRWSRWQSVMDSMPIAVLARPNRNDAALDSEAAKYGEKIRLHDPKELARVSRGWCFIDHHQSLDVAASSILKQLRAGERGVPGLHPKVQDYILSNRLYGLVATPPQFQPQHRTPPRPRAPRPR